MTTEHPTQQLIQATNAIATIEKLIEKINEVPKSSKPPVSILTYQVTYSHRSLRCLKYTGHPPRHHPHTSLDDTHNSDSVPAD